MSMGNLKKDRKRVETSYGIRVIRFPFSKTRFKCPLMILDSLNKYGKENSYHIKFIYWQSAGHWIQTRSIWKSDRYFLKRSIKKIK